MINNRYVKICVNNSDLDHAIIKIKCFQLKMARSSRKIQTKKLPQASTFENNRITTTTIKTYNGKIEISETFLRKDYQKGFENNSFEFEVVAI